MNSTIIPKQLYVTIQYRKDTQDKWAYGSGTTVNIDENDDITVSGGGTQGGYGHMKVDASILFMTNCYPLIINNELTNGFQISKSVRRSGSWGGGGNVLWRIADPRGFELEISSSNFAALLNCTTIINGVIQGNCLWGRNGKDNILLPESSDVYQSAAKLTAKISTNISLKDIKVGDIVELLIKNNRKEENTYQYLGKYFFLVAEQEEEVDAIGRFYGGRFVFNKSQVERYLLKNVISGKYEVFNTPKILSVVKSIETPLDKIRIAKEVTSWLDRDNSIYDILNLILVSPIKIKLDTVTTQLVPLGEIIDTQWPQVDKYCTDTIVSEFDGKFWLAIDENIYDSAAQRYNKLSYLKQVDIDTAKNKIILPKLIVAGNNWYNGYNVSTRYESIIRKDFTFDQLKMYRLEVTTNGITGKVYRLR